jgi:hypothetical protein
MTYYVDPNTQQMYYQAPAQQNETTPERCRPACAFNLFRP